MVTKLKPKPRAPRKSARFPIVGVVPSAGGLEAFKRFPAAVPADCGMTFVLVPHLDPKYESQMVPLLSKTSLLPVVQATQGMAIAQQPTTAEFGSMPSSIISEGPFSKLDLISCRNLLIYLEPEMQQRVISLFHFALADNGSLMLGPAESIGHADDPFKSDSGALTISNNTEATHLYRVAQEAINNAQRHGAAKEIKVSLLGDQHQIQLKISDDGIGVDVLSTDSNGKLIHGTGLQIMEYRASVIGGNLPISAGINNGTIVTCTIPRQRNLG
jgi:hypothetical protein